MATTKKKETKTTNAKKAPAAMVTLCPSASSTSAINYYGSHTKARKTAYAAVMQFAEESKAKKPVKSMA